jgi:hypothetical protein
LAVAKLGALFGSDDNDDTIDEARSKAVESAAFEILGKGQGASEVPS